jgi:hypothetical protein
MNVRSLNQPTKLANHLAKNKREETRITEVRNERGHHYKPDRNNKNYKTIL